MVMDAVIGHGEDDNGVFVTAIVAFIANFIVSTRRRYCRRFLRRPRQNTALQNCFAPHKLLPIPWTVYT